MTELYYGNMVRLQSKLARARDDRDAVRGLALVSIIKMIETQAMALERFSSEMLKWADHWRD
ncbi:MAG: hypothetical protein ABIH87_01830 [bacterium]